MVQPVTNEVLRDRNDMAVTHCIWLLIPKELVYSGEVLSASEIQAKITYKEMKEAKKCLCKDARLKEHEVEKGVFNCMLC